METIPDVDTAQSAVEMVANAPARRVRPAPSGGGPSGPAVSVRAGRTAAPSAVRVWRRLMSPSLGDRAAAVRAATESQDMRTQPGLRTALVRELVLAIEQDRREAAAAPAGTSRAWSPAREYFEALSQFQAVARDPRALPLLAFADAPAVYSLMAFGHAAIPHILFVLRKPTPTGYSDDYKLKVFEMLRRVARVETLAPEDLDRIAGAALDILRSRQATVAFVREALLLAEAVNREAFDTHFSALAAEDDAIRAFGIQDPAEVALVRETAMGVLSRRLAAGDAAWLPPVSLT